MEITNEKNFTILNLSPNETDHPLLVLESFFNIDNLEGHLERLKEWRRCVLEDEYFKGDKGSPAELLSFHHLNIRLLEAAYLLKENNRKYDKLLFAEGKSLLRTFCINEEELNNPYLAFIHLFNDYDLAGYREMLNDWLYYGLSVKAANEFIETTDLIKVYENLQKLYIASWAIYAQNRESKGIVSNSANNDLKENKEVKLYKLSTSINNEQQVVISQIISVIKSKLSTVQAIIYLGCVPDTPNAIFLLVLTDDNEQRQAQSLASMIEESCVKFAAVTALVHHASILLKTSGSNLFFNRALRCPAVLLSGNLLLPVYKPIEEYMLRECSVKWERWMTQGKDFLNGAAYYLSTGANKAALFSMQQSAECLLLALIRAVTGYGINNHNLERLLKLTEMFTGDLADIFDKQESGRETFDLLKHAYINVRYKDTFEFDERYTVILYQCIERLFELAERVYQKHLLMNNL